ncbi:MAG: hypothetical protein J07HX64_01817 [halophilic archaeon J07HX64]|nr:MAG: hypothetical protein J07HX64_01817 [halophilic archaeon J07HX64]
MGDRSTEAGAPNWPDCGSEQVRVMLLGTFHMANPGLDEVNVDADDVLSERRQTELRELVDRLTEWEPQRLAVERRHHRSNEVNSHYREYRSGERAYDRAETLSTPHPDHSEPNTDCRSEVVQVGFRLADRLGHDSVAAVDEHPDRDRYSPDPFEEREFDTARKTPDTVADPAAREREYDRRLASSTVPEYLAWLNSGSRLRTNHEGMFDRGIRGADARFGSPVALAYWYDRNIRMVHHLWRTMDDDDSRVLLLVGSGHVRALGHLLTESPMFCPVSPLPYLPGER